MKAFSDPSRIAFAPDYAVQPVDGLGVFFIGERRQWQSNARIVVELCRLIDGHHGVDALIAAAAPRLSPPEVLFALSHLERLGVVIRVASLPAGDPAEARHGVVTLERAGIAVQGEAGGSVGTIAAALGRAGLAVEPVPQAGPAPRLLVVDDYLDPAATAMITAAASAGCTWTPVKLAGERAYFGPSFGPGLNACWPCLRERLRANRPVESFLERVVGRPFGIGAGRAVGPAGLALAGVLAERLASDASAPSYGVFEWQEGGLRRHPLPTRAACPRCGEPDVAPILRPPALGGEVPLVRRAGGYRVGTAEATCRRLEPLVSDLTGRIASIERLDTGTAPRHVYAGAYLIVPSASHPAGDDFHGAFLGKGRDDAQARASALCEAVERISAIWRDATPSRLATLADLGETAIAPDLLWNFSPEQIEARAGWNAATADPRRHVPEPLPPDRPIAWAQAWSLTAGEWRWLPRDHCFANTPEPRCGRFNPNGHAAGSTLGEAVLQGFLELVERDCTAVWWYNRLERPGVDPLLARDGYVRNLAAGLAAQGWRSWLLDLTSDLRIPCLAALARAESDGRWCVGFGCHFETAVAIERAMSELEQLFRADGRDGPAPWAPIDDGGEAFLYPASSGGPSDAPTAGIRTLGDLIGWCRDAAAGRGLEMLVIDQTHPAIGLPVAKVIVPGLRHFWPRFGPGRLYDVPVAMGWRSAPLAEAALNPSHLFL